MNLYCRLPDFKAAYNVSDNLDDELIVQTLGGVARGFDRALGRHLHPTRGTKVMDSDGHEELLLPFDLLSVASLAANGVALTEETHYLLYPYGTLPATSLVRLNALWPRGRAKVSITGVFGYADISESSGATVQNTGSLGISATSLELAANADVEPGDMLVIESEEIYVRSVVATEEEKVATITRACNGTTAAAHANGVAISRRRYPADIEEAAIAQGARMVTAKATGHAGSVGDPDLGGFSFNSLYPMVRDLLTPHRRWGIH